MSNPTASIKLLLRKAGDPAEAQQLAGMIFDFCLDQRLDRFLALEQILEQLDRPAYLGPLLEHLRQFVGRQAKRSADTTDRIDASLTPEARRLLADLAAQPIALERSFIESVVEHEAVKQLLRMVVMESLTLFIKDLKDGGNKFIPSFGKLGIGAGLFQKFAAQFETGLHSVTEAFVNASLDRVLKTVVQSANLEQMSALFSKFIGSGLKAALKLETSVFWRDLLRLRLVELLEVVPGLLRHNLTRPGIRKMILAELGEVLTKEGSKTLRQIVQDEDLLLRWRQTASELGGPFISDFSHTDKFKEWLSA